MYDDDDLIYAYELADYDEASGITLTLPSMGLWLAVLAVAALAMLMWGKYPNTLTTGLRSPLSASGAAGNLFTPAAAGEWTPVGESETWCVDLLRLRNIAPRGESVGACVAWIRGEGTYQTINNPLNTTQDMPGQERGIWNSHGVKIYDTRQTGLEAAARTLDYTGHGYEAIVAGLAANDGDAAVAAIEASDWGTGGIAAEVWRTELAAKYKAAQPAGQAPAAAAPDEALSIPADVQAVIDSVRALVQGRLQGTAPAAPLAPARPASSSTAPLIGGKKAEVVPNWQARVNGRFDSWNCDAWGFQGCIHYGTDIVGQGEGTEVFAPFNGSFASCQDNGDGGALIGMWIVYIDEKGNEQLINHFRELRDWCSQVPGTPIRAGDLLGTMRGDANHVHMQTRVNGELVDFEEYWYSY